MKYQDYGVVCCLCRAFPEQLQRSVHKLGAVVGEVTHLEEMKGNTNKFVSLLYHGG